MGSTSYVSALMLVFAPFVLAILIWILYHFHLEGRRAASRRRYVMGLVCPEVAKTISRRASIVIALFLFGYGVAASAQVSDSSASPSQSGKVIELEKKFVDLESELNQLRDQIKALKAQPTVSSVPGVASNVSSSSENTEPAQVSQAKIVAPARPLLPAGATLNVLLDGYYEYNFNHPPGRANSLRAYDVLSNSFSLNQAAVVFELPASPDQGRRFGARVDLQFGQATATLQGNSANENRPDVYRNIFQAYGRYVIPISKGLTVDFGKWASSLGYEANYTKDQLNYTRSYFFYFLPFYHTGIRTSYQLNDKVAVNYWLTNGTQQTEPFNSFKDELFGLNLTPRSSISWTTNYYLGQEHPDVTPSNSCGNAPLQPGLCFSPIANAPNGKTHIFDSYASWQMTPRFLLGGEADYVIQRQYANSSPDKSSAPSHVLGGAAYVNFQVSAHSTFAVRGEYLSDRGGLFSGQTQALKEMTASYTHRLGDGFESLLEYRRDWSNRQFFPTGTSGALRNHQDTATVGLVWWYGGKTGTW